MIKESNTTKESIEMKEKLTTNYFFQRKIFKMEKGKSFQPLWRVLYLKNNNN